MSSTPRFFIKLCLMLCKSCVHSVRHNLPKTLFDIFVPVAFFLLMTISRTEYQIQKTKSQAAKPYFEENFFTPPFGPRLLPVVAYSPNNTVFDKLLNETRERYDDDMITYIGVDTAENLEALLMQNRSIIAGIQFNHPDNITEIPDNFNFSLRFPAMMRWYNEPWPTDILYKEQMFYRFPRDTLDWNFYRKEGFLTLQYRIMSQLHSIDYANRTLPSSSINGRRFPDYPENLNFDKFQFIFPPLVLIAFLYTYLNTICCIVVERKKQTKEMVRLMGISDWIYWLSLCLQKVLLQIVTVTIIVALMKTRLGYSKAVFENSDFFLLWRFFFVYCTCFISLGFLMSIFFTDLKIAISLSTVIWFVSFLPFSITHVDYKIVPDFLKMALYILPNTAMGYGIKLIFQLELMMDNGLDRSTLWNGLFPYDILSVGTIMSIMLCTSVVFLGILMYIAPIFPGRYGVAASAYYLFTKDFWNKRRSSGKKYSKYTEQGENDENFSNFENEPESRTPGIQIKNLTKTFVKGKAAIIRNLSLNIYKNEITVLCGPNASGKTTLMLILTGMLKATSGTALINGYDIQKRTNLARKSMGFCPQQNILLDGLTAREHILFYSLVKGSKRKAAFANVKKYSKLLDFGNELNVTTSKLSFGTQRKLSIALAFCGRTKFVLLDHPSHSLDPAARRLFWNVLINEKKDRVILMTTHLSDEVDVIADRIAFITDGELKCCGSSNFVRKRFGIYRLVCTKDEDCKSNSTTRFLNQYFPGIAVETETKTHLSYLLSYHNVHKFGRLFEKLEAFYVSQLKLKSFRISIATTEFLFNEFVKESVSDELSIESVEIDNYSDDECLCRMTLIPCQVAAILMKRFLCGIRKWRSFILYHLIVIILMIPVVYDLNLRTLHEPSPPPLEMSLDSYENSDYCFLETSKTFQNDMRGRIRKNMTLGYKRMFGSKPNSLMLLNVTDLNTYAQNFGVQKYRYNFLIGISLTGKNRFFYANTFSALHTVPISFKYYMTSRLFPVRNVTVINAPLSGNTAIVRATSEYLNMEAFGIDFPVFIGILIAIISSSHIIFYIKEKRHGTKMKQYVNGANRLIFWLTSIVWDLVVSGAAISAIVIWLSISERAFWSELNVLYIVASILFMFNLAMLPITCLLSLIFSNPATGVNSVCAVNTFLCMMSFVNNYGAQFIPGPGLLSAIPVYALIECLMKLSTIGKRCQSQCEEICDIENRKKLCEEYPTCCPPFSFLSTDDGISREILYMGLTGLIALLLLLVVEHEISKQLLSYGWNFLLRSSKSFTESREHILERDDSEHSVNERISEDSIGDGQEMDSCFCPVKSEKIEEKMSMHEVSKYYGRRLAVDEISLTLKCGECVGLIGKNGMGKTTIFKMLTGEHRICYGEAFLFGLNLKWNTGRTHDFVGYCPQSDRLWDDLTVGETLRFFCLLRDTPFDQASDLAKNLNLSQHFTRKVSQLSGGKKQILSVVIALIGDPTVVFLDEVTTCIDDSTKRALWTILGKLCDSGKSILISSDNMQEYQTVCTRFTVAEDDDTPAVESKPVSIELLIESNMAEYKINNNGIVEFMKNSFKEAKLRSAINNFLTFDIPYSPNVLSKMFMVFEKRKRHLCIENYYVWVK